MAVTARVHRVLGGRVHAEARPDHDKEHDNAIYEEVACTHPRVRVAGEEEAQRKAVRALKSLLVKYRKVMGYEAWEDSEAAKKWEEVASGIESASTERYRATR